MTMYMSICPKCGRFKVQRQCPFCNLEHVQTPTTLNETMNMSDTELEQLEQYYIDTLIKDTFDQTAKEYRLKNENPVFHDYVPRKNPTVTCPYCKSTNTYKIHTSGKVLSAALFGIFALPGISKQWGCKDCKSEF